MKIPAQASAPGSVLLALLIALSGLLVLPSVACALPRFAARVGASCSLCHVDPSGGGMRTDYARNV